MKPAAFFGLVALLPMALATSPAQAGTMTLMICTGNGPARSIEVPLPGKPLRQGDEPCCMKGCHSAGNRKKAQRQFDAPQ